VDRRLPLSPRAALIAPTTQCGERAGVRGKTMHALWLSDPSTIVQRDHTRSRRRPRTRSPIALGADCERRGSQNPPQVAHSDPSHPLPACGAFSIPQVSRSQDHKGHQRPRSQRSPRNGRRTLGELGVSVAIFLPSEPAVSPVSIVGYDVALPGRTRFFATARCAHPFIRSGKPFALVARVPIAS
jgi:hypothetical protein